MPVTYAVGDLHDLSTYCARIIPQHMGVVLYTDQYSQYIVNLHQ